MCHRVVATARQPVHCKDTCVEEGAEECREEHHFREDEPQHADTERTVDLFVVVAGH
jgi:hypothetical protein